MDLTAEAGNCNRVTIGEQLQQPHHRLAGLGDRGTTHRSRAVNQQFDMHGLGYRCCCRGGNRHVVGQPLLAGMTSGQTATIPLITVRQHHHVPIHAHAINRNGGDGVITGNGRDMTRYFKCTGCPSPYRQLIGEWITHKQIAKRHLLGAHRCRWRAIAGGNRSGQTHPHHAIIGNQHFAVGDVNCDFFACRHIADLDGVEVINLCHQNRRIAGCNCLGVFVAGLGFGVYL